ncbi:MAG: hypothetical protein ACR2MX_10390 [Cyclobacteriaceae bacterium]
MRLIVTYIVPVLVSLILLIGANYLLQPAPLTAALAVAGGLLTWFFRKSRLGLSMGMLVGMLFAVVWHGYQHISGQSTSPEEGLTWHLVLDGIIGYLIASVILWLAIVSQSLLNRSKNRDPSKEV